MATFPVLIQRLNGEQIQLDYDSSLGSAGLRQQLYDYCPEEFPMERTVFCSVSDTPLDLSSLSSGDTIAVVVKDESYAIRPYYLLASGVVTDERELPALFFATFFLDREDVGAPITHKPFSIVVLQHPATHHFLCECPMDTETHYETDPFSGRREEVDVDYRVILRDWNAVGEWSADHLPPLLPLPWCPTIDEALRASSLCLRQEAIQRISYLWEYGLGRVPFRASEERFDECMRHGSFHLTHRMF